MNPIDTTTPFGGVRMAFQGEPGACSDEAVRLFFAEAAPARAALAVTREGAAVCALGSYPRWGA